MNTFDQSLADIGKSREANCETHGTYQSHRIARNIWSQCPDCSAERKAREEAEREEA